MLSFHHIPAALPFVWTIENNDYTLTFCFSFAKRRVCAQNYGRAIESGQTENYKPIISRFLLYPVEL